jgi:D-3-phosphoglycerate dehydrogenase
MACATRFAAFGAAVSYWTRRRRAPQEEQGATYRPLDDLVATSDVLVVAIALSAQTRGLIDADRLALLPPGAVVINAGRGGIVNEDALVRSVESGALLGAALDVFVTEPLPPDSPLRRSDRILLYPHLAGGSVQSRSAVVAAMAANLERAVHGQPVHAVVNGVAPDVRWR